MAARRTYVATYPRCRKAPQFAQQGKKISMASRGKKIDTNGYLVARAIHYQAGLPIRRGFSIYRLSSIAEMCCRIEFNNNRAVIAQ
jgi:hypothetical protein